MYTSVYANQIFGQTKERILYELGVFGFLINTNEHRTIEIRAQVLGSFAPFSLFFR
jgi:hypothetical protein